MVRIQSLAVHTQTTAMATCRFRRDKNEPCVTRSIQSPINWNSCWERYPATMAATNAIVMYTTNVPIRFRRCACVLNMVDPA